MNRRADSRPRLPGAISRSSAEHYVWGSVCDGWHLLKDAALSVIHERVPPGAAESAHLHVQAQQFFFVLSGTATLEFGDGSVTLREGEGLHVPPGLAHRFANHAEQPVEFLVISSPAIGSDRVPADRAA